MDQKTNHSETAARNAAIKETIAILNATRDEWAQTAMRSANKLIGERNIVIDKFGRAFGQFTEDGEAKVKLELPNASLVGVSHMDRENAEKAVKFMEAKLPDAAPFAIWDFEDFANKELSAVNHLIGELEQRVTPETPSLESQMSAALELDDEPSGP